jgi:Ca2+-binding RTX toxin-like protein
MIDFFPGNILTTTSNVVNSLSEVIQRNLGFTLPNPFPEAADPTRDALRTAGTLASFLGSIIGPELGKRLSDYNGKTQIQVETTGTLIGNVATLVVGSGGKIEAVDAFTKYDIGPVGPVALVAVIEALAQLGFPFAAKLLEAVKGLSGTNTVTGAALLNALGFLTPVTADNRQSFTELATGFTGDLQPKVTNALKGPELTWASAGSDKRDVLTSFKVSGDVDGGKGDDLIIGASSNDSLIGGEGNDIIWGRASSDTIWGDDKDAKLSGNDIIRGGAGDDSIFGGRGDDFIDGGDINQKRADDGFDIVDYTLLKNANITIEVGRNVESLKAVFYDNTADIEKYAAIVQKGAAGTDILYSIEKVRGTASGDIILIDKSIGDLLKKTDASPGGSVLGFVLDLLGQAAGAVFGLSSAQAATQREAASHGDTIDASGSASADSEKPTKGMVFNFRDQDSEFVADVQGALPTQLGYEGKFPKSTGQEFSLLNKVSTEFEKPTDLSGYAADARLSLKDVETVIGTYQNDLLIGADTVYTWKTPEPPAGTDPNAPPPEPQRVVDKDFQGYDLIGGKGDDTILIYKGDKDQVTFHKIEGGEGKDVIAVRSAGKTEYKDAKGTVHSIIDGGADNDVIFSLGATGKGLEVFGGTGRDFIYVKSAGADVYGDTIDGLDPKTGAKLADDKTNADQFWFAPNITIKDAGHYDVLSFFGMPLTGGNIAAGGAFAEAITSIAGYTAGGLALAGFSSTLLANQGPTGGLFWDNLVPFINYVYDAKTSTLYVANYFDQLSALFIGHDEGMFSGTRKVDDPTTPEDETKDLIGFMKIDNFDFWGSYRGDVQSDATSANGVKQYAGTLNMVFKQLNPVAAILDLLPPTAITLGTQIALGGGNPLIDATFTLAAAAARWSKAIDWIKGSDPLVLDLDGNGIEFSNLASSRVYFDLDGDKFAEHTAWLKGSDGFLVVDANHNGRIDDIAEMFGGVGVSGYQELAGYDSNHDGVVDARDTNFSELRIWRDLNQNGVTDAGELQTLADAGIVSLSATAVPLDATTPQGVYLADRGTFTRADGTTGRAFDATLPFANVDTKYAGETGRAA